MAKTGICRNLPERIAMADSDGEIPQEKCVGCMVRWLEKEEEQRWKD